MQYKHAHAHVHPNTAPHQQHTKMPQSKYFNRHTARIAIIVVFAVLTVLLSVSLSLLLQQM